MGKDEDVDLSILTEVLASPYDVAEINEPWEFTTLKNEISATVSRNLIFS